MPPALRTADSVACLGSDRGPVFYEAALEYAQSLWLEGLPARSLLLLNRAMGCALEGHEPIVQRWPIPYGAVAWILQSHQSGQFLGNPRRHWQHLATRMVPPRKELRTWRAWACWFLARRILPDLPADDLQIAREGVREPEFLEIASHLDQLGLPGESDRWRDAVLLT
jgi:hypothetical protein